MANPFAKSRSNLDEEKNITTTTTIIIKQQNINVQRHLIQLSDGLNAFHEEIWFFAPVAIIYKYFFYSLFI